MIPRQFKYIIVDGIFPILFTGAQTHRDIAGGMDVTSAGFGQIYWNDRNTLEVMCYGESTSLKKKSIPVDDAAAISRMLQEPI